jgi:hypothetical protein
VVDPRPAPTNFLQRLRYTAVITLAAAILVFAIEPRFLPSSPLLGSLSSKARESLYDQISVASVTLMGFLITAVAILVALDRSRQIVKELRRGESFSLLVLNLLAAVVLLFALGLASIAGAAGLAPTCDVYLRFIEWLGLLVIAEVLLGGFFFCVVTYKVASYD